MALESPLLRAHLEADASILQYGPEVELPGQPPRGVGVVETFGQLELEYAAIGKHCVLMDLPQHGTVEITGSERLAFLNRMLTQELKGQQAGEVRRSFWLNRKGRIDADVRVIEVPGGAGGGVAVGRTLLDLDVHAVKRTIEGLSSYIITEDCAVKDVTEQHHRLALHGPTAAVLLNAAVADGFDAESLPEGRARVAVIGGHEVLIDRDDATGAPGFELLCSTASVAAIYQLLLQKGADPDADDHGAGSALKRAYATTTSLAAGIRLRRAGWHAFNIARIENGRPLFNLDFTTENLPAESGVLESRVSFTKGCYLGQEIVARMHSRGHPKQKLVALRVEQAPGEAGSTPGEFREIRQPVTGSQVYAIPAEGAALGESVGTVTSSTISPLLGAAAICFAQVKYQHIAAGTALLAQTEAGAVKAVVQDGLRFVKRG